MAKLITAQPKFTILVANLLGSGDPSKGRNPTKLRTGITRQTFLEIPRSGEASRVVDPSSPGIHTQQGLLQYTASPVPVATTAVIVVASNDFTAKAKLCVGPYTITSGDDFTPGGDTAATAVTLAAAIDALPDFSATVGGSTVTVRGPAGPNGNDTKFKAVYSGTVQNYTLTPTTGYFAGGEPIIGPPLLQTR